MKQEFTDNMGLKIMLVDDDDISSYINSKVIEKVGLPIDQVSIYLQGEKALKHLENIINNEQEFPDLILLDINMPVMDGWGFLDKYRETIWPKLNKRVVVSMLSSSFYQEDIDKAFSYPQVNDYVSKPLTSAGLNELLGKHFSKN